MLSWIIQITIISIILIFLVHYLFNFFKSTLTVPKIKDLVNIPNQKYKNMYNIISKNNETFNNENLNNENQNQNQHNYTEIDLLPKLDTNTESNSNSDSMKNELKNFLKKQLKEPSTDISTLNSSKYSYSEFF